MRVIIKRKRAVKLIIVLALPLILIAALWSYQLVASSLSYKKYPAVGTFVDVGGYSLHLYAIGENNGLPTVILESGLPTPSSFVDWSGVQDELSRYTRVISYDRAGYGWSEFALNDRTAQQLVLELHTMLHAAGETGPFVLVGHSFGGFIVQLFGHLYPEETYGLVLLDSASVDLSPPTAGLTLQKVLRQAGVFRLLGNMGILPLPDAIISNSLSREFLFRSYNNRDQISEFVNMATTSAQQVKAVQDAGLGSLPIVIISSHEKRSDYPNWLDKQKEMLSVSNNTRHIVTEDSGHFIQYDDPQLVVEAVLELLLN